MFIADFSITQETENFPPIFWWLSRGTFMSLVKSIIQEKELCHKISFIKIQTVETATKFFLSVAFDIILGGQSSIDNKEV